VYALAHQGAIYLKGVLIDFPPPQFGQSSPDVEAVAQLNLLTGLAAPVAVGSPVPVRSLADRQDDQPVAARGGASFVLRALRAAAGPVVIHIVGSCRDIALAANTDPALFRSKCAAIYLNAGTGCPDPDRVPRLEYNVGLNPEAYAAIFAAPCPLYWMPCFETYVDDRIVRDYGTWYHFRQDEILPSLSPALQRYFAGMLNRTCDSAWLTRLAGAAGAADFGEHAQEFRNMWCTGGFLHSAGYTVAVDGGIVPLAAADDAVFAFEPIAVTCDEAGRTTWHADATSSQRFIFRVRDRARYAAAMTTAMKTLLMGIPDIA
jgi:hypothetical protein